MMLSREQQLRSLLDRLSDAERRGQPLPLEELCADCPELIDEVRRQLALRGRVEEAAWASESDDHREDTPAAPSVTAAAAGVPSIPGYEILGELGGGGMGVVYKARDTRLKRLVALKVIRDGLAGPVARARFQTEAELVARLNHPNVVQIYEIGEWQPATADKLPYLALEYVEGGSLSRHIRGQAVLFAEAARLVALVARAVQAGHDVGVVHRDLKPDNILLTADKTPKVSDFGLARRLAGADATRLSEAGAILGTPSYMSPEQAEGAEDVGPATDVWALGAILYRLLTGRPAFEGDSVVKTLRLICEQPLKPPRELCPDVPAALEAACQRCLTKDPRQRPTAGELARLLEGYPAGEPTVDLLPARPSQPARRRLSRRAAIGLALAGLPALGGVWWWRSRPARPFKGYLDIEMTRPGDVLRQNVRLADPASRPLREGDEVRVEVKLSRPGYAYVVWIDTAGEVGAVYPWVEGDWSRRDEEKPVTLLQLPRKDGRWGAWPVVGGKAGLETLALLVRETPLPAEVDLPAELAGLGPQALADREGLSIAWFENGQVVRDEPERAPDLKKVFEGGNPLERVNHEVQRRVGKHFAYTRAVTFGNLGSEKRRGE